VGEDKAVSVAEAVGSGHFALGIHGLEAGQVAVVRAVDRGEGRKGLGVDVAELHNILKLEFTKQTRADPLVSREMVISSRCH
jgi:hypothetical protein